MPIEKASVKRGENLPPVVTAARSINVALFLSNALRRNVSIALGIEEGTDLGIVTFPGETLRRVSPDERSITFFLLKAVAELNRIQKQGSTTMDNGIIVQKTTALEYVHAWKENTFLAQSGSENSAEPVADGDSLYIYEVEGETVFQIMHLAGVKRSRTPERYILDINMIYDEIEWPMKKSS
jgi:tRNA pseudouridine-54 N-methylase